MSGNPDGMALYSACTFSYGGQDWEVESYVLAELMLDGELMQDDSCHFLLRVVFGSQDAAVLLDEQVQLGVPAADVWVDGQEQLHVTCGMCVPPAIRSRIMSIVRSAMPWWAARCWMPAASIMWVLHSGNG